MGAVVEDAAVGLAEYLAEYALERGLAEGTEYVMGVSVRAFDSWLGRPAELADLTDWQVSRWLRDLEAGGRLAQRTIAGRRGD